MDSWRVIALPPLLTSCVRMWSLSSAMSESILRCTESLSTVARDPPAAETCPALCASMLWYEIAEVSGCWLLLGASEKDGASLSGASEPRLKGLAMEWLPCKEVRFQVGRSERERERVQACVDRRE